MTKKQLNNYAAMLNALRIISGYFGNDFTKEEIKRLAAITIKDINPIKKP